MPVILDYSEIGGKNRQILGSLSSRSPVLHGKVPANKTSWLTQKMENSDEQHLRLSSGLLVHVVKVLELTHAPIYMNAYSTYTYTGENLLVQCYKSCKSNHFMTITSWKLRKISREILGALVYLHNSPRWNDSRPRSQSWLTIFSLMH